MSSKIKFEFDEKAIKAAAVDAAKKVVESKGLPVSCPKCKKQFSAGSGRAHCPYCGHTFDIKINYKI